jgi:hypothetical protein
MGQANQKKAGAARRSLSLPFLETPERADAGPGTPSASPRSGPSRLAEAPREPGATSGLGDSAHAEGESRPRSTRRDVPRDAGARLHTPNEALLAREARLSMLEMRAMTDQAFGIHLARVRCEGLPLTKEWEA